MHPLDLLGLCFLNFLSTSFQSIPAPAIAVPPAAAFVVVGAAFQLTAPFGSAGAALVQSASRRIVSRVEA